MAKLWREPLPVVHPSRSCWQCGKRATRLWIPYGTTVDDFSLTCNDCAPLDAELADP